MMGKRSDFPRKPRDDYPTPEAAVLPLLPHLKPSSTFDEPCCGDGQLVEHLENFGHKCLRARDLYLGLTIDTSMDARLITSSDADYFITNPPWERDVMHAIIENLSKIRPCWLLIDADWMHTKQAIPYMSSCRSIVSIGRVKWIPDSKSTGLDNCCWYLFDARQRMWPFHHFDGTTCFHARLP